MKQTVINVNNSGKTSVYVNGKSYSVPAGPLEIAVTETGSVTLNGKLANPDTWKTIEFKGTADELIALAKSLDI